MRIGRSCVEVIRVLAPSLGGVEVDNTAGVVGPKHNLRVDKVVGWVKWIERRAEAVNDPEFLCAFQSINHATTVSIGVRPVSACLILNGIRNRVTIKVRRQQVISRIVLRIGSVKVLITVTHTTRVGVN